MLLTLGAEYELVRVSMSRPSSILAAISIKIADGLVVRIHLYVARKILVPRRIIDGTELDRQAFPSFFSSICRSPGNLASADSQDVSMTEVWRWKFEPGTANGAKGHRLVPETFYANQYLLPLRQLFKVSKLHRKGSAEERLNTLLDSQQTQNRRCCD